MFQLPSYYFILHIQMSSKSMIEEKRNDKGDG